MCNLHVKSIRLNVFTSLKLLLLRKNMNFIKINQIKNRIILIFFYTFLGVSLFVPASAMTVEEAAIKLESIIWYTEEYPPFNFADENEIPTGITVDILLAAFKKIGVNITAKDIKIISWNRSYNYVQKKPGTALFSMTYTPEREKIVSFVGPALQNANSVIALKEKKISIKSPLELSKFELGVVRNDIGDQLITKQLKNKEKIRRLASAEQLYSLLQKGKLDAIVYSINVFNNIIKNSGGDPTEYEEVLVLSKNQVGYAFHKSTDPDVLAHLQQAIDELKADGTIKSIISGYNK